MALKRVLEPEIMDTERDAREYEAIDHAGMNRTFADFVAEGLRLSRGKLIDLGAGPCAIPVAICRRIKGVHVTAVEAAPAMVKLAEKRIAKAGCARRIRLLSADAKDTKLPGGSFDFVISNNLVHHIADPRLIFREIARLCRPGGGIFLQDLIRPRTPTELKAHLRRCAVTDTPRQQELLKDSLRAALRMEEVGSYASLAGLAGFTLTAEGSRHWRLYRPLTEGRTSARYAPTHQ